MIEIKTYHIHPTPLIPNSPRPLLHYKNVLPRNPASSRCDPVACYDLFHKHGWHVSWIFRYGATQHSHFHSQAHECMAVLSGTATIRFGVADTSDDLEASTHGGAYEKLSDGAPPLVLQAEAGDVFIIPSGVAHKTHKTEPRESFALLTPGNATGIEAPDPKAALAAIELSGYTMMGAYSGGDQDFVKSGGDYESIWSVPKPEMDPVFGREEGGLRTEWPGSGTDARYGD